MAADMNSKTIGGLVAYADWLLDKGYAGSSQIGPWKIAIRKVFEAVDGTDYESTALDGLDLEDVFVRFRKLTASTYKTESQDAYVSRVRRAIEAYEYWQENNRPPAFRQVAKRSEGDAADLSKVKAIKKSKERTKEKDPKTVLPEGFIDYPFPLRNGQIARLSLPQRLEKADVDRMVQWLHALQFEPQAQIPERTGEQLAA